jgi:diguanylate cyclase (GGDEF)-like protein
MKILPGPRADRPISSPLEGLPRYRAQQAEASLQQLAQREWWMWFSAVMVTMLSAAAFLLTFFHRFFQHTDHFYELRPDQALWGVLALLLLFNGWMVYRQWSFRRLRKCATQKDEEPVHCATEVFGSSGLDPVTGLLTRMSIEQQLGKEIARARRQNSSLSLATLHLNNFEELSQRHGKAPADEALKEFARRLKEASRGSDYAVRLANDDFVLVLPKCNVGEVTRVLKRVGTIELNCSGETVSIDITTGWVDYQPGDMPSDLLKRATQLLHLYEDAAKESFASGVALR